MVVRRTILQQYTEKLNVVQQSTGQAWETRNIPTPNHGYQPWLVNQYAKHYAGDKGQAHTTSCPSKRHATGCGRHHE